MNTISAEEAIKIVKDLAAWSEKYPRGRTYHISKMSMDDELIALEERAKKYVSAPQTEEVRDVEALAERLFPYDEDVVNGEEIAKLSKQMVNRRRRDFINGYNLNVAQKAVENKSGLRWIKASERLPDSPDYWLATNKMQEGKIVHVRIRGFIKGLGRFVRLDGQMYLYYQTVEQTNLDDDGCIGYGLFHEIEWLDELVKNVPDTNVGDINKSSEEVHDAEVLAKKIAEDVSLMESIKTGKHYYKHFMIEDKDAYNYVKEVAKSALSASVNKAVEQKEQPFENYPELAKIIEWFANNVPCPGTEWNKLLREINNSLKQVVPVERYVPINIAFAIADRLYGSDYPLAWSTFERIKKEVENNKKTTK